MVSVTEWEMHVLSIQRVVVPQRNAVSMDVRESVSMLCHHPNQVLWLVNLFPTYNVICICFVVMVEYIFDDSKLIFSWLQILATVSYVQTMEYAKPIVMVVHLVSVKWRVPWTTDQYVDQITRHMATCVHWRLMLVCWRKTYLSCMKENVEWKLVGIRTPATSSHASIWYRI